MIAPRKKEISNHDKTLIVCGLHLQAERIVLYSNMRIPVNNLQY